MSVHATAIARRLGQGWTGVLLYGPSGAGKSDLALRALQHGWRLVSDDYSLVWASGGRLWARAPDLIADRIEARGLGILPEARLALAPIGLIVACDLLPVERLPEPEEAEIAGLTLPAVRLNALESSALAKLERALSTRALSGVAGTAYLGSSREPATRLPARAETPQLGPQQGAKAR